MWNHFVVQEIDGRLPGVSLGGLRRALLNPVYEV
jgi:hypothetical protein